MDSDDPDPEEKNNVCPICERDFKTLAGIRQYWARGHSEEEMQAALTKKMQTIAQQSVASPTSTYDLTPTPRVIGNKFQIIATDNSSPSGTIFDQFDVIENDSSGDCLLSALLRFLECSSNNLNDIPNNTNELRLKAVNHICSDSYDGRQSNFDRFRHNVTINLRNHIPDSLIFESDEAIKTAYATYMSTPGKYGTTAELCAISELFGFAFFVIQQTSPTDFVIYDYGSSAVPGLISTGNTVHLLFTGNASAGHFRLLIPIEKTQSSHIPPGRYKVVDEYTSSRMTSISKLGKTTGTYNESKIHQDSSSTNGFICDQSFESERGLNIHRSRHNLNSNGTHANTEDSTISETAFDDYVNLLGRCKKNARILKRIPRGARVSAAYSLAEIIDECMAQPSFDKKWMNLLTYAYTALKVPDKNRKVSLATSVKQNIIKPTLSLNQRRQNKTTISISRRIEYKIAEGDVKGAVKILSSNETLAPRNLTTLNELMLKHPPPSRPLNLPEPPQKKAEHLMVSEQDVVKNINGFPNGPAAGIDGILPQHIKDLTAPNTGEAGLKLVKSITNLCNFMLAGKIPSKLCAIMYGASLCALNKEQGGIRPIAVGNTFRRLTAKMACASVRSEMSSKLAPRQVGFGVRGGCEAAAHATRTFIKKNRKRAVVILKIDFRNAFNELDRDKFLEEMKMNCAGHSCGSVTQPRHFCFSAKTRLCLKTEHSKETQRAHFYSVRQFKRLWHP